MELKAIVNRIKPSNLAVNALAVEQATKDVRIDFGVLAVSPPVARFFDRLSVIEAVHFSLSAY
jgi:hypothetical protein